MNLRRILLHIRLLYKCARYAICRIYIGNENGVVYVLDAETGEKLSFYVLGSNSIWSGPSLYKSRIYVGSFDGNVYCLEEAAPQPPPTPSPEPTYPTAEEIAQKVLDELPDNPTADEIAQRVLDTLPDYPSAPTADEVAQKVLEGLPDIPSAGDTAQEVINQLPAYPETPAYRTIDIVIIVAIGVVTIICIVSYWLLRKRQ